MADAASLIVRVKTEGAEQSAKQLDSMAQSAAKADTAATKAGASAEKATPKLKNFGTGAKQVDDAFDGANKELPDFTKNAKDTGDSAAAAAPKLRGLGTAAQQIGFQVQDMVVQIQSGTSAFVAIGQQGSQLAGAFGPGGAVIGAVIALSAAIGGVLYNALGDSTKGLEDIEKAAKDLDASFQVGKDGVIELSDSLLELAQNGDAAYSSMVKLAGLKAQQQLDDTTRAIKEQSNALFANNEAANIALTALSDLNAGVGELNISSARLDASVGELANTYGVTEDRVRGVLEAQLAYNQAATPENAQALAEAQLALASAATKNKDEIIAQAEETQKLAVAHDLATRQVDRATEAQKGNAKAVNTTTAAYREQTSEILKQQQAQGLAEKDRITAEAALDKERFAKRKGVTEAEIKAYNAARDEEARRDVQRVIDTENRKAEAEAKAADRREASIGRRETRQKKSAEAEQKRIDAQTKAFEKQTQDSFELQIEMENRKAKITAAVDPIAKLEQERQARLEVIAEYEMLETANHQAAVLARAEADKAYEEGLLEAKEAQFRAQSMGNELLMDSLDALANTSSRVIAGIITDSDSASEAVEQLGKAIIGHAVSALVEMGAQYIKNAIIGQTAAATASATAAASGAAMATAYAPAAAFASLASFGANAAPASAGIASTVALSESLAVIGAREQGGNLAAGQMSTIAERGQPEVIMPASASRVRTAQQMKQIMGENGGGNTPTNVQIVNQTTGRVDSATTEQMDERTLRVIIRETVSGDMTDSNSSISKSRRATRNQAGF